MIFFKTYEHYEKEQQRSFCKWYKKRERVFLLFPRWLANGQLAWLQYVYKDRGIYKDMWKDYNLGETVYYLEE